MHFAESEKGERNSRRPLARSSPRVTAARGGGSVRARWQSDVPLAGITSPPRALVLAGDGGPRRWLGPCSMAVRCTPSPVSRHPLARSSSRVTAARGGGSVRARWQSDVPPRLYHVTPSRARPRG
ncbi:hypothetical protein EVAR_8792_1 [Eumeta japonica]|uniref:Uncharacterized protein n=1 Tax=Eumeta variegata TaxID=151549 RepID=A0A4C1TTU0_EUMVA|nr:hypothetical protein EVAR_8792_1 [Eumeta japonica]